MPQETKNYSEPTDIRPPSELEELMRNQVDLIQRLENSMSHLNGKLERIVFNRPVADQKSVKPQSIGTTLGIEIDGYNSRLNAILSQIQYLNENLGI